MEDILTDSSNDIMTAAGDSGEQSIRLLMNTSKGEWKENPLTGVGVVGYLDDIYHLYLMAREVGFPLKSITLFLANVHYLLTPLFDEKCNFF